MMQIGLEQKKKPSYSPFILICSTVGGLLSCSRDQIGCVAKIESLQSGLVRPGPSFRWSQLDQAGQIEGFRQPDQASQVNMASSGSVRYGYAMGLQKQRNKNKNNI